MTNATKTTSQRNEKMTKSIAQQIVDELIKSKGSKAKALAAAKRTAHRMESVNAHLWHWNRAIEILKSN